MNTPPFQVDTAVITAVITDAMLYYVTKNTTLPNVTQYTIIYNSMTVPCGVTSNVMHRCTSEWWALLFGVLVICMCSRRTYFFFYVVCLFFVVCCPATYRYMSKAQDRHLLPALYCTSCIVTPAVESKVVSLCNL